MGSKRIYKSMIVLALVMVIALTPVALGLPVHAQFGGSNVLDPITSAPAVGEELELWVYPTADPTQDKLNVQWAVDNIASGGKVVLKAQDVNGKPRSLNFGTDMVIGEFNVVISRSCIIEGEVLKEKLPGEPVVDPVAVREKLADGRLRGEQVASLAVGEALEEACRSVEPVLELLLGQVVGLGGGRRDVLLSEHGPAQLVVEKLCELRSSAADAPGDGNDRHGVCPRVPGAFG